VIWANAHTTVQSKKECFGKCVAIVGPGRRWSNIYEKQGFLKVQDQQEFGECLGFRLSVRALEF
jgi:hypothetical protein